MTERTPRLKVIWKYGLFGLAVVAIFAATVLALLRLLPGPHSTGDYLIIGGLATFLAMLVVLVVLVTSILKAPDPFFKRRPR